MIFTFADGIAREIVPGTVVNVNRSVLDKIGSMGFPYTEDNRWLYVSSFSNDELNLILTPTGETFHAIITSGEDIRHLHSADHKSHEISAVSNGTLSSAEHRYYYVSSHDVLPLDEVLPLTPETVGIIPHRCYYCHRLHDNCANVDDRWICPECVESHTFVCSECGNRHDIRRRMRGSLELCRVCFDSMPEKYARAENGNVYKTSDLVKVGAGLSTSYVTPEYAEGHTVVCETCGTLHLRHETVTVYGHVYCISCCDVKYPKCAHCGRRHAAGNTFNIEGKKVCRGCRERYYVICDICGKYHTMNNSVITTDTGKRVCHECLPNIYHCEDCDRWYENAIPRVAYEPFYETMRTGRICDRCLTHYHRCEDCGGYTRNRTSPNNKLYCGSCFRNHYWNCAICGKTVSNDDGSLGHGSDENRICHECYEASNHGQRDLTDAKETYWEAPYGMQSYNYKPDPILFPAKNSTGLFYGIELETDRSEYGHNCEEVLNNVNDILGFTYAKHDGSLGCDGIEFVSHPATIDYYINNKNRFAEAMAYLKEEGYQSHSGGNCGLHVHVSSFPLLYDTENGVEKLMYLWDKFWNEIVKCSRRGNSNGGRWASRIPCNFTSTARDAKYELAHLKNRKKDSKNSGRYQCINLQNDNTIEFRLMRGTLNIDTFIGSLQLISTIVEIVMAKSYEELRDLTWDDVLNWHDYAEFKALWESHKKYSAEECGYLDIDSDDSSISSKRYHIATSTISFAA